MQVTIYCMCPILLHPSKKHLAYFVYQGKPQLIFLSKKGIIQEVLNKSYRLIDIMLSYYSKVTAVLVQLHQAQSTEDNKLLTRMVQKLKGKLKKHYKCEIGYFWVREQDKAESHHYHMVIMLNGHKCQQSTLVDKVVQEAWQSIHPDNFSFRVRNRIYRIHRNGNGHELRALRMRLSYMAKKEGKTEFSNYTNVFRYSRLKNSAQ
ncbi:inovirus Gp2 family protein [Vibrio parahaemolyticus]|nr:inovirus Gp2 family protein [Vibrio parahaemolyticus]MBE4222999.1 inovirus Gp2 family protein [Vibrio parahaemolyticus]MBE5199965.1 inovirus Gp2 family protein [Vibrio parahaemolyticus]TOH95980.1 hypothetical protein CGI70_20270 [Vibrio parahaemolyticus]TOJ58485.1 hypothetical protein CGI35_21875 [Vibrio parahaemolyticus]